MMKNLNVLLTWTHAAVIEDLLEKQDVKLEIADKFGYEKYMKDKLKTKGKGIHLIQAGKSYVKEHGKDALANVAKLHFKTMNDIPS